VEITDGALEVNKAKIDLNLLSFQFRTVQVIVHVVSAWDSLIVVGAETPQTQVRASVLRDHTVDQ